MVSPTGSAARRPSSSELTVQQMTPFLFGPLANGITVGTGDKGETITHCSGQKHDGNGGQIGVV